MAKDKKARHDFDEDISEILEITSKGSLDKRLITTVKISVSYATECYGYEDTLVWRELSTGQEDKSCVNE